MPELIRLALRLCHREILVHLRQLKNIINVCLFFSMLVIFFPLTMPADPQLMRIVAPGLVWIAVLLSFLLSADRIFQTDYDNGVIEQWLISGKSLNLIVFSKISIHWLINVLPLLLLCPLIALLFSLTAQEAWVLALSLILGTPSLIFLCALASVFGVGSQQKSALIALILIPLTLPVMIFGSATLTLFAQGVSVQGYLAILLAISLLAVAFLPYAIAAVIRISLVE